MLNTTVENLITQAQEAQAAAAQKEKQQREETEKHKIEIALVAFQKELGDLHEVLRPYMGEPVSYFNTVAVGINAAPLNLAKFEIFTEVVIAKGEYYPVRLRESRTSSAVPIESIALFLKSRRDAFPEQEERARAAAAYEAEQAELKIKKEEATVLYREAWESYARKLEEVRAHNKADVERVQALFDVPFHFWKLTYSYVGQDDESAESSVETSTVNVLAPEPDADGLWTVWKYDGVYKLKYFHLVSISEAIETKPSAKEVYQAHGFASHTVYVQPGVSKAEVEAVLYLKPLPDRPEQPEVLSDYECRNIEREGEYEPSF